MFERLHAGAVFGRAFQEMLDGGVVGHEVLDRGIVGRDAELQALVLRGYLFGNLVAQNRLQQSVNADAVVAKLGIIARRLQRRLADPNARDRNGRWVSWRWDSWRWDSVQVIYRQNHQFIVP